MSVCECTEKAMYARMLVLASALCLTHWLCHTVYGYICIMVVYIFLIRNSMAGTALSILDEANGHIDLFLILYFTSKDPTI